VTFERSVNEPGSAVNDYPEAAEGAAAFQATDQVVGHFDSLDGAAENKLVRVQKHRFVETDFDHLHQVVGGLFDIDEGALGVAEDQDLLSSRTSILDG